MHLEINHFARSLLLPNKISDISRELLQNLAVRKAPSHHYPVCYTWQTTVVAFATKKDADMSSGEDDIVVLAFAALTVTLAAIAKQRHNYNKKLPQSRYHRPALLHSLLLISTTSFRQIIACGVSSNFFILMNFDRDKIFNSLLPLFFNQQTLVNYRTPFRQSPKTHGHKPFLSSVDILGMTLWYLKSSSRQYSLCTIFGMTQSCVTS